MWPYYGGKYSIAHLYPKPKHNRIIEPFAGTAQYSLIHFDNDVLLVDKWDVIIKIWKWLQQCSKQDILGLPRLKQGERLSSLNLSEEEKLFMGFVVGQGQSPRDKASAMTTTYRPNRQNYTLRKTAEQLFKIKHWQFVNGSYECLGNTKATWFIDPPYQHGGHVYVTGNKLDYLALGEWSKSRLGHVIVCENTKADWLPFKPMRKMSGTMYRTVEAIWSSHTHNFELQQMKLF